MIEALKFTAALFVSALYFYLTEPKTIYCEADSPHGPTVAGVVRIEGCP